MAGASLAAELAPFASVTMIEAEDQPGFHATGRSAAFWHETYGGAAIQPLSRASFDWLMSPPESFSPHGFLSLRTAVTMARSGDEALIDTYLGEFSATDIAMRRLDRAALSALVPGLMPAWQAGVFEPDCCDIDVGGLHNAYLRAAKRAGAVLHCRSPLHKAHRDSSGIWEIDTGGGVLRAATLVNAAGAWADDVALRCGVPPLDVKPYRRTVVQLRLTEQTPATLPLIVDARGDFYFKGAGTGRIWLSPHDETPDAAQDVAADELDVAIALDRLASVVDWHVDAVERRWAGLRSFAPDRLPVLGRDADLPEFAWCAGQGGVGIQTAPAVARLLAAELLGRTPDADISSLADGRFGAGRFR